MKISKTWCSLLWVAAILAGCSLHLKITLLNNSGEDIVVTMPSGKFKKAISLKTSAVFAYPDSEQNWTMHLVTASCDYAYQLPEKLEHYDWKDSYESTPVVQVDTDFRLYLLPRKTTKALAVPDYQNLQQDGFPLSPASKICQ